MFEMIYMLLSRETITAKEFAEYFNVSVRTIYRYIDDLTTANIPIYMKKGRNGGISLLPNYTLNKTTLSKDEKDEILSSLSAFQSLNIEKETNPIINKISGIFGELNQDWLEVDFTRWKNKNISSELFKKIRISILQNRNMNFEYFNSYGDKSIRKVSPLKLIYKSVDWYLYAYDINKSDYRIFKLKRMKNVEIHDEKYSINDFSNLDIDLDYSKNENMDISIKLEISKYLENFIFEEYEDYKTLENGNFLIELKVSNYDEIIPYILSYGHYCKIISPIELKNIIMKSLEKNLQQYI